MTYPVLTGLGAERLKAGPWRLVVVGAGGWLGLATLEMLHALLGEDFQKRVVCFGSDHRTLNLRGGVTVSQRPLSEIGHLPAVPSLVLHLAFLTQEKAKAMTPGDYDAANRAISGAVLGALDAIGAEGVFVPSSGAVYMVPDPEAEASKRQYGALKLEDEASFAAWGEARGARVALARVFNLSGPYINKQSSYALACFIADALAGRPILIRAARPVYRSFTAISELMSVVFGVLTDPVPARELFDTAGDQGLEMAEVAHLVAEVVGHGAGVERPAFVDGPADRYLGDISHYARLRARYGVAAVAFSEQIRATAVFMAEDSGR